MIVRRGLRWWMRRDVRRIIASLSTSDREMIYSAAEAGLARFHLSLGMFLWNEFRAGRFGGLQGHCRHGVESSGTPMSFDALSAAAIHEIWQELRCNGFRKD